MIGSCRPPPQAPSCPCGDLLSQQPLTARLCRPRPFHSLPRGDPSRGRYRKDQPICLLLACSPSPHRPAFPRSRHACAGRSARWTHLLPAPAKRKPGSEETWRLHQDLLKQVRTFHWQAWHVHTSGPLSLCHPMAELLDSSSFVDDPSCVSCADRGAEAATGGDRLEDPAGRAATTSGQWTLPQSVTVQLACDCGQHSLSSQRRLALISTTKQCRSRIAQTIVPFAVHTPQIQPPAPAPPQQDDTAQREAAERERQRGEQERLRQHREWERAQALAAAPAQVRASRRCLGSGVW